MTRFFVLLLAAVTFYSMGWLLLFLMPADYLLTIRLALAALCALAVALFVWKSSPGFIRCVGTGAIATGLIGFVAGFFGPLIFAPGANQGPLLGLFTGPLGFVLGALGSGIYWIVRGRRGESN